MESTIHQKDRLEVGGKRLEKKQTSDNQTSDRKPSRLSFRLQTVRISRLSCIPTRWYQLSTDVRRSPFLSRKKRRFAFSLFRALGCLPFYKRTFRFTPAILAGLHSLENCFAILADPNPAWICGPVNPQDSHRQRTCSSRLFPFSPERETCCMLSLCGAFEFLSLYKKRPLNGGLFSFDFV